MSGSRLLIADVHAGDGQSIDLLIADGQIAAVGPGLAAGSDVERIAGGGGLVTRSFVDGHIHLDKTLIGFDFIPHIEGASIAERIAAERHLRKTVSLPVEARGGRLIEQVVAFGTGAVRSHVDIDTEVGLKGLEAVLALKARYAHLLDIQTVAFPQSGVVTDPGTADLLDAAIGAGADLVGGLDPAGIDHDVSGHLDAIFAIAERHGVGLDIHLHDAGALGAFELRQIAERTRAIGAEGKVAVSHAFCLGALDPSDFARTAEALAMAGVAIMTTAPGPVPMPPVKPLLGAGVEVFSGSDNIRDAWSPFGNGDMLERAGIVCDRQDLRADADLDLAFGLATAAPARVLGFAAIALEPGDPADLVVLPAGSIAEAVAARPLDRMVFKRGQLVARGGRLVGA